MRPEQITYRLLVSEDDRQKAHAFLEELGQAEPSLGFPTVLGWKDGEIVTLFATHDNDEELIAGPLAWRPMEGNLIIRLVRTIEAYENVLRYAGVKEYLCYVPDKHARWKQYIEEILETEPLKVETDRTWYRRIL